jgi:hypothetical protein
MRRGLPQRVLPEQLSTIGASRAFLYNPMATTGNLAPAVLQDVRFGSDTTPERVNER